MEMYHYEDDDLYDFVKIIPSAIADIVYWQQQGYSLVIPRVPSKIHRFEEIH